MIRSLDNLTRFRMSIADHVATVTIANPPVNAQDTTFRDEIIRVFDILGGERDVRAIVLTGDGKHFSGGADLAGRAAIAAQPGGYAAHNRLVRAGFDVVMECPKPVIAAVRGAAVGAGAVLALVCDILVVSEDAYMSMTEVDYGFAGGVRHVLRAFSPSDARLMIYTARRITGSELYRMNVASACVPVERLSDEAHEIAATIAQKVPMAVIAAKRSFGLTEEMPLRDGYRYEQTQTAALADSHDTKEALAAFREKRKPVFRGD